MHCNITCSEFIDFQCPRLVEIDKKSLIASRRPFKSCSESTMKRFHNFTWESSIAHNFDVRKVIPSQMHLPRIHQRSRTKAYIGRHAQ